MACLGRKTFINIEEHNHCKILGYNAFREVCGLGRVKHFDLLTDLIPVKIVERLKLLYAHVDDIDLFVGGISEAAETESMLGECQIMIGLLMTMFQINYFYGMNLSL